MLLCSSLELTYFGTRCHYLLAILFCLAVVGGGGDFPGVLAGQVEGEPVRGIVRGAPFWVIGVGSFGIGTGASNVSLGFVLFPASAFLFGLMFFLLGYSGYLHVS